MFRLASLLVVASLLAIPSVAADHDEYEHCTLDGDVVGRVECARDSDVPRLLDRLGDLAGLDADGASVPAYIPCPQPADVTDVQETVAYAACMAVWAAETGHRIATDAAQDACEAVLDPEDC